MTESRPVWFAVPLAAAFISASIAAAQTPMPDELLIYYGWPSSINGTFSVPAAAGEFAAYDIVVLGDGLSNASHPDHANTAAIMAHSAMTDTDVFGYIDLGISTQNLSLTEIGTRVDEWAAIGAEGIFLDDYGYDFLVTRDRQNAAVQLARDAGLPVIANGFFVDQVFGSAMDATYNPSGTPPILDSSDFYLFESYQVRLGEFDDAAAWYAKSETLMDYQESVGFGVLSITTTDVDGPGGYVESAFWYAWYSAALYGHRATGWGEASFSAAGASNGQAPYRTRPDVQPGSSFLSDVFVSGDQYLRNTDEWTIIVHTDTHVGELSMVVPVALDSFHITLRGRLFEMRWTAAYGEFRVDAAQAGHTWEVPITSAGRHSYQALDRPSGGGDVTYTLLLRNAAGRFEPLRRETLSLGGPEIVGLSVQNPVRTGGTFTFNTAADGHVIVDVYDLTGRRVASLIDRSLRGGRHVQTWPAAFSEAEPGVYYLRVATETNDRMAKVVIVN